MINAADGAEHDGMPNGRWRFEKMVAILVPIAATLLGCGLGWFLMRHFQLYMEAGP